MDYLHAFIDVVQKAKKDAVGILVSDPALQNIANRYVDDQTKFAKTIVDTYWSLIKNSWDKTNCFSREYFPQTTFGKSWK